MYHLHARVDGDRSDEELKALQQGAQKAAVTSLVYGLNDGPGVEDMWPFPGVASMLLSEVGMLLSTAAPHLHHGYIHLSLVIFSPLLLNTIRRYNHRSVLVHRSCKR